MVSIAIDYSLFIQIVNFLILMIALNIFLYRPLRNMIRHRKDTFQGLEDDIAGLGEQADQQTHQIESSLAEAQRSGYHKKDEIKEEGLEEEKTILAEAAEEADVVIQRIREQIAGEIGQARRDLTAQLDLFSQELAQKVLGRSLS
jgi:F-type H+-transporting ATPase subunit b